MITKTAFDKLNEQQKNLVIEARMATKNAYAPYSKFYVGSAALLKSGAIVTGSNQENVVFPLSLCAERVCLLYAGHAHPQDAVVALVVSCSSEKKANPIAFPCGSCRQVIAESETRGGVLVQIIVDGGDEAIYIADSAKDLLPFGFEADFLK
ncbi:MAG: cytidine deaminase [Cyclobacteriaceae bacterium]